MSSRQVAKKIHYDLGLIPNHQPNSYMVGSGRVISPGLIGFQIEDDPFSNRSVVDVQDQIRM